MKTLALRNRGIVIVSKAEGVPCRQALAVELPARLARYCSIAYRVEFRSMA